MKLDVIKKKIKFFIQGLKNFKEIGTVTRSGPAMCRKIAELVPANSKYVLELGAGDGVITRHLLKRIPIDGKVISFEINPELYLSLAAINDDRLITINDTAELLPQYLKDHNISEVDAVVCAIPFIVLEESVMYNILKICQKVLKKGNNYIQVHYAKNLAPKYKDFFGNLIVHKIIKNIPPAYVFQCIKEKDK